MDWSMYLVLSFTTLGVIIRSMAKWNQSCLNNWGFGDWAQVCAPIRRFASPPPNRSMPSVARAGTTP